MHALVRDHCVAHELRFDSCLDIGCGRTRLDKWVGKSELFDAPRRYVGLELDDAIRSALIAEDVDVRHPFSPEGKSAEGDIGVALEIVEHLEAADTIPFLSEYLRRTHKLFVLSTPNCEYWTGRRAAVGYEHLRFLPDHYPDQLASRSSPHSHKQAFTPETLADAIASSLPGSHWRYRVYRAWPWTITDMTRPVTYPLYFKLFALVWPQV
ncbi:hypothetical protein [Sandaracinus amylolyticus]|uniref:hypothetical protein n=1 Tax=Sandaracinus amylolyticus TaxID=927083 RepID=UPI0012ED9725|nr:hypothetical protein [Sandaracinus amylolyticus]